MKSGKIPVLRSQEQALMELNRLLIEGALLTQLTGGSIIDVTLAANETKRVSHGMSVIPQSRVILRQIGNGLITDTNDWDEKKIGLINNSANEVKVKILLLSGD